MQIKNIYQSALILALLTTTLGAASPAEPESKDTSPAKVIQPGKQSALKMGMASDAVIALMGKPASVRSMPAPNGKAEVWIYSRQMSTRVDRVGFPSADVVTNYTGADGKQRQSTTPGAMQYHDVRYVTDETVEVLIFNNHYVTEKTTMAERQLYE